VVTVEMEPPTSPPDEPTPLNQNAAPSLCRAPTRGEGDLAVLVALAAGDHIRNLQPDPAESGIDDNAVWARAGVNGEVSDSWVFGLIRREWRPSSAPGTSR
jgi:hypothetical protein